ncbi:unnamed protein product [Polarella glacialis]|uniref:IPT/TIG domain-containing protein n=1 Tax=Polarella glacialis TaxID=89957 RepID=A0A813HYL2_POLGL|nr:unnamed protein product [Polarella glacialis]
MPAVPPPHGAKVESDTISHSAASSACEKSLGTRAELFSLTRLGAWLEKSVEGGQLSDLDGNALMPCIQQARESEDVVLVKARRGQWRATLLVLLNMAKLHIRRNVVTYSASASACKRSNEWEGALAAISAMAVDGISLDIVAFSAVVSAVAGSQGTAGWKRALEALQQMQRARVQPNTVVVTTAISACDSHGCWEVALGLLAGMFLCHAEPNAITHTAFISTCGSAGRWQLALQAFVDAMSKGVSVGTASCNAALSACEGGGSWGRWEQALVLFRDMRLRRLQQDLLSVNSAIAACGFGVLAAPRGKLIALLSVAADPVEASIEAFGRHDPAADPEGLLCGMWTPALIPDAITYGSAMLVLNEGGQAADAVMRSKDARWVSSLSPRSGSIAGGTYVVLVGSGFRHPGGHNPFGRQSVLIGQTPCTILEDLTTGEQIVCETPPASAAGPPQAVCVMLDDTGICAPSCSACKFQYAEEETPHFSWFSQRSLTSGSLLAFGASVPGSLRGAEARDRVLIDLGGYTCDASEAAAVNSADFLVEQRTLNCAVSPNLVGPRLTTLRLRSLPVGLGDPNCATYPCVQHGQMEHGYGFGILRNWLGQAQVAPAFFEPSSFNFYDLAIIPQIMAIGPSDSSGLFGGGTLLITGNTFDTDPSKTSVTVGGDDCAVTSASSREIRCELGPASANRSGCVEFDVFAGSLLPGIGSEKLVQYDATKTEVLSCSVRSLQSDSLSRSFSVAVGNKSSGNYWSEDPCQTSGEPLKASIASEEESRVAFCCELDGSSCDGAVYEPAPTEPPNAWLGYGSGATTTPVPVDLDGRCVGAVPWEVAHSQCTRRGLRLCKRAELNSGLCCGVTCSFISDAGVAAWTSEEVVSQDIRVSSDDGEAWTEDLWLRCKENCLFRSIVNETRDDNGTDFDALVEKSWETILVNTPPMQAPFVGGRGFRYAVYTNPSNFPLQHALGAANPAYPLSPLEEGVVHDVLRSGFRHVRSSPVPAVENGTAASSALPTYVAIPPMLDDTGHDHYAEVLWGYFVAPLTARYSFYLAADDEAELAISDEGLGGAMTLVARATAIDGLATPRYSPMAWHGAPCSAKSICRRVRHREREGADWLRVGLRIAADSSTMKPFPPELTNRKSFFELQRLTLAAVSTRETYGLDFYSVSAGSFQVNIASADLNGYVRSGTTQILSLSDTISNIGAAIAGLVDMFGEKVLSCDPETTVVRQGTLYRMLVTFPCLLRSDNRTRAEYMTITPSTDVTSVRGQSWVMNSTRLSTSSALVSGQFRLYFGGKWSNYISYKRYQDVAAELEALPGLEQAAQAQNGFEEGEVCSALAFALLLPPPLLLAAVTLTSGCPPDETNTSFFFVSLLPPAGVKTTPFFVTFLSDSPSPGQDSSWRLTPGRSSGGFALIFFFPGADGIATAIAFLTLLRLGRPTTSLQRASRRE